MRYITGLFILLLCLAAITYTSCKKDPCDSVYCFNEGTCIAGKCSCPTGFSGETCEIRATTTITYKNNTFTPVTIIVKGETKVLPVDSTITFSGPYGDLLNGSAYTYQVTDSGARIGGKPTWAVKGTFPAVGSVDYTFDVPSTMFYLKASNTSQYDVHTIYVNYQGTAEAKEIFRIPNNGQVYPLGYYFAYGTSNVRLLSSGNTWLFYPLNLPMTKNQTYTATAL